MICGSCHKLNRLQLLGFKAYAIGLLDNAVMIIVSRTHMRVLFYMVICASVFAENWGEKFLVMNIRSLELSSEYPITKYAIPD